MPAAPTPAPAPAPAPCWACHRTAQFGTPAEAAAVEPHLCPRCDHAYALSLTGGDAATHPFRGEDSPTWTAPTSAPTPAPVEPPVRLLLTTARTIVLRSYGALARLSTLDGDAWVCTCVDADTLTALVDLPSGTGASPRAAVLALLEELHAQVLREALADVADDAPDAPGLARCTLAEGLSAATEVA